MYHLKSFQTYLIIDEISMLSCHNFDLVNKWLEIKGTTSDPTVLFGDRIWWTKASTWQLHIWYHYQKLPMAAIWCRSTHNKPQTSWRQKTKHGLKSWTEYALVNLLTVTVRHCKDSYKSCLSCKASVEPDAPTEPVLGCCTKCGMLQCFDPCPEQLSVKLLVMQQYDGCHMMAVRNQWWKPSMPLEKSSRT